MQISSMFNMAQECRDEPGSLAIDQVNDLANAHFCRKAVVKRQPLSCFEFCSHHLADDLLNAVCGVALIA